MPIFRAEVAWCISINIFSIDISSMLDKGLNHAKISSQACNMKWCSKIISPCINLSIELDEDLDHWCMAFTCGQMERSESIRVGAIYNLKHFILLVKLLFGIAEDLIHFVCVSLIYFCPIVHLHLFYVFLTLLLLRGLLRHLR